MRRKQSMQHLDQRQQLLLENAYYQVGLTYGYSGRLLIICLVQPP